MGFFTPLLTVKYLTKTMLTDERKTMILQQMLFWCDLCADKLSLVEGHCLFSVGVNEKCWHECLNEGSSMF